VGQIIVRNLDDAVIGALKRRAERERKSLEQLLRDTLTEIARGDRTEWLAGLDRIRAMAPTPVPGSRFPSAEDMVREDRDRR